MGFCPVEISLEVGLLGVVCARTLVGIIVKKISHEDTKMISQGDNSNWGIPQRVGVNHQFPD